MTSYIDAYMEPVLRYFPRTEGLREQNLGVSVFQASYSDLRESARWLGTITELLIL